MAASLLITRTLRTPHSERYLLAEPNGPTECAVLDLHYLANGTVRGTLVVFEGAGIADDDVPALIQRLDEQLLPDVQLDDASLEFTVVMGRVLGAYARAD
jgi:hypothetical protein